MRYIKMSLEEAKTLARKDAVVLVNVQDLTSDDCNTGFDKKYFGECYQILDNAECITQVFDEFADQLRVFSEKQTKFPMLENKGNLHTILFKGTDVRK